MTAKDQKTQPGTATAESTPESGARRLTPRERRLRELEAALLIKHAVPQARPALIAQGQRCQMIDPKYLLDNPYQKREDYEDLESLADKMRQFGFKGTLSARNHPSKPGHYQIAFGHRRLRAALLAGVVVRVVVEDLSDREMALLAISESCEREDLTLFGEGDGLPPSDGACGMSQEATHG